MLRTPIIRSMLLLAFVLAGCGRTASPTPTLLPTMTPRDGWHSLESQGFQIWVPDSYVGGTKLDIDSVLQHLNSLGPSFGKAAESIKQQGSAYVVFAIDTAAQNPLNVTNVLVGKESGGDSVDIGSYTDTLAGNLKRKYSQYEVLETQTDTSGRYPTGRVYAKTSSPQTGDVEQVMYAVKGSGAFWQIVFTTPAAEFEQRAPVFDQIAHSISLPYSPANQTGSPVVFLIGVILVAIGLAARMLYKPRRDGELSSTAN